MTPQSSNLAAVFQEAIRQEYALIDWRQERERYIGRIRVLCTKRNYQRSLARLEAWCAQQSFDPVDMSPALADDWIADELAAGWATSTVNLDVTSASAFWTWLERRHVHLRNPFRGTRERPKVVPVRPLVVPSAEEIEVLIGAAQPVTRAMIVCLARLGLRRGALPGLTIADGMYRTISKGRFIKGCWPPDVAAATNAAGLDARRPFAEMLAPRISDRIRRLSLRLYEANQLDAIYSAHDLRHAFAVAHYQAHRDVYATSRALCHASVDMTAVYLRSLPGVDF